MSTIRKRNLLDTEPNVEPIAVDLDPRVDRIDTEKHLPLYLLNRPDEPNITKIGTGSKSRMDGMFAKEALATVTYGNRYTRNFAWRKALIVPRRFQGREFTDSSLIDALDKRFKIPRQTENYGSKEVRAASYEKVYECIRKYFGDGELDSIHDHGGYHYFQRQRKIENKVDGRIREAESKSPRGAPPVNSLAYLAPRFGKVRKFLRFVKRMWKKHNYGAFYVSPYWLSVHNGFLKAIANYKEFRNLVFIDARPGEQDDWEEQFEEIYNSDDKFPVVGLSLVKGDGAKSDIQKVTYVPKNERITLIDEADFGAHTKDSEPLIEYIEETEHAYSWGPKNENCVPIHIYTTGTGFDRLAKFDKDWDTIDMVPYLTLVNKKHEDKDYGLDHIVEPHYRRWNAGKTLSTDLKENFNQENIPTLYQLTAKAEDYGQIWQKIWRIALSNNPYGKYSTASPLNIPNEAQKSLRNYSKLSDGLGVMAMLPSPNDVKAKKKLAKVEEAADTALDDWAVMKLCGNIPDQNFNGITNAEAEDEVKKFMETEYNPDKHLGVLVLTMGVGFRSFTVPDISVVANFTDGGRAARVMQGGSRNLSAGTRDLLGNGKEKKDGLFIDFGFDQSKDIGAVSKILALQLEAEQESERGRNETKAEVARRLFDPIDIAGFMQDNGQLGQLETSTLLADITKTNKAKSRLDQKADLHPLKDNKELKRLFYKGNRSDTSDGTDENKNVPGGTAGTSNGSKSNNSSDDKKSSAEILETYNKVAFTIPVYAPKNNNVFEALDEISKNFKEEWKRISGITPEEYKTLMNKEVLSEDEIDTLYTVRDNATESEIKSVLAANRLFEMPVDLAEKMALKPSKELLKGEGGVAVLDAAGPNVVEALRDVGAENVVVFTRLHLAKRRIQNELPNARVEIVDVRENESVKEAYERTINEIDMKFDVAVGNPPYQKSNSEESAHASPIYNDFVRLAKEIAKETCLVIPGRWFAGGRGLTDFRRWMLNRKDIVSIEHDFDAKKYFPSVKLRGGICVVYTNENVSTEKTIFNGEEINLGKYNSLIPQTEAYPIVDSIKENANKFLEDKFYGQGFSGLKSNDKRFCGESEKKEDFIKCYVSQSKGFEKWVDPDDTRKAGGGFWKVITAEATGKGGDESFGNTFVGKPKETCTQSYVLFQVSSAREAISLRTYMETDFAGYLLSLRKNTQHISSKTVKWIPVPPLDRIWTDEELKEEELFGLSDEQWKRFTNNDD